MIKKLIKNGFEFGIRKTRFKIFKTDDIKNIPHEDPNILHDIIMSYFGEKDFSLERI